MIKFVMPKVCKRCWNRNGFSKVSSEFIENEQECKLCNGCFLKLNEIADRIIKELESIPGIRTFSIGTSIPKESEAIEEKIWDFAEFNKWKSIKPELNTELGKIIEKKTKYKFSQDPDVRIIYDIKNNKISKQISSVYLYGKYNKLQRGIRQTKKEDAKEESVEGLIERILIKEIGTEKSKAILHGSGREDIDVLMLGEGRPFVMEVTNPRKRVLNEKEIERINNIINKINEGKIKVKFEKIVNKEWVEIIKRAKFDKEYEAIVNLEKPIDKNEIYKLPKSVLLMQRTPKRVLIRRSDLIRKRRIKMLKPEWIDSHTIKLHILSESGTYIKEFISGDEGRTQPSISSLLKTNATCKELNVISIHSEWLDDLW
ncbi:MAG: tRNA pseudouridine(54/55) synthase Pus10 [Candidatus Micrarchaeia archaeon]